MNMDLVDIAVSLWIAGQVIGAIIAIPIIVWFAYMFFKKDR